jgi:hypothetical protein
MSTSGEGGGSTLVARSFAGGTPVILAAESGFGLTEPAVSPDGTSAEGLLGDRLEGGVGLRARRPGRTCAYRGTEAPAPGLRTGRGHDFEVLWRGSRAPP